MPKIATCLWFDNQAEEAAKFYVSVFERSKILDTSHYTEAGYDVHKRPAGSVMTVTFELDGMLFTALNGGPQFKFSEAISLEVHCSSQEEVDRYWDKLLAGGGQPSQCGWLKDKFGLSWQVFPVQLNEWIQAKDKQKAGRVMEAMLKMKKLDLAALKRAYDGHQGAIRT